MQNIRVNLDNYKLTIVDPPALKFKRTDNGAPVAAVDREGRQVFTVSLFAKPIPAAGEFSQKGEEIAVTLAADPGPGFEEGTRVVLVDATVSPYNMPKKNGQGVNAGIAFKALSITLAHAPAPRPNKDQ